MSKFLQCIHVSNPNKNVMNPREVVRLFGEKIGVVAGYSVNMLDQQVFSAGYSK